VSTSRTFWPASKIGEGETLGKSKAAATSSRAPVSGISDVELHSIRFVPRSVSDFSEVEI
jgi:hypothetical protein